MKNLSRTLLLLALAVSCLPSNASAAEEESGPETIMVDLNGDGRSETISRRLLGRDAELGTFYQVLVQGTDGKVLWRSPEVQDFQHPLAFGSFDFGVSLPVFAADLDRDGTVKMLAPAPQSDVSSTFFRVFRWTGSAFEPAFSRALTGPGRKGAMFGWTETPREGDFWVGHWLGASPEGGWIVQLVALPSGDQVVHAIAVLLPKLDRFQLVRWIQVPAPLTSAAAEPTPGRPAVQLPAPPTAAGYRARLSQRDHFNSSGAPLKTVNDILRQDRANVHRGLHRDPEDQLDERFGAAGERELLGRMRVRLIGGGVAAQRIVSGTPVVRVTVLPDEVRVEIVSE